MNRKLKTRVPCHPNELKPQLPDYELEKKKEKTYRDKTKADYGQRHRVVQPNGSISRWPHLDIRPQVRGYGLKIWWIPTVSHHRDVNGWCPTEQAHDKEHPKQSCPTSQACFHTPDTTLKGHPRDGTTCHGSAWRRTTPRARTTLRHWHSIRPTSFEKVPKGPLPTTKICWRVLKLL